MKLFRTGFISLQLFCIGLLFTGCSDNSVQYNGPLINKWSIVKCEVIRSPKNPMNIDTVNQNQVAIEGHIFMSPTSIVFKANGSFNASLYKFDTINYPNGNWKITPDNKRVIKIDSATGKVDTADIVMLTADSLKIGSIDSKGNQVVKVYHSHK